MSITKKSPDRLFAKPPKSGAKCNIIFWYDEGGRFAESVKYSSCIYELQAELQSRAV